MSFATNLYQLLPNYRYYPHFFQPIRTFTHPEPTPSLYTTREKTPPIILSFKSTRSFLCFRDLRVSLETLSAMSTHDTMRSMNLGHQFLSSLSTTNNNKASHSPHSPSALPHTTFTSSGNNKPSQGQTAPGIYSPPVCQARLLLCWASVIENLIGTVGITLGYFTTGARIPQLAVDAVLACVNQGVPSVGALAILR